MIKLFWIQKNIASEENEIKDIYSRKDRWISNASKMLGEILKR